MADTKPAASAKPTAQEKELSAQEKRAQAARQEFDRLGKREVSLVAIDTIHVGQPQSEDDIKNKRPPQVEVIKPGETFTCAAADALDFVDHGRAAKPDSPEGRAAVARMGAAGEGGVTREERRLERMKKFVRN